MDVFKAAISLALLLTLSGCGRAKSTETVYNKSASPYCVQTQIQSKYVVQWESGEFTVESAPTEDAFKEKFLQPRLEQIKHATPDYLVDFEHSISETVSESAENASSSWGQEIIEAPSVWSQGAEGQNIIVGVVDSYVDSTHPQLVNNMIAGKSFISQPGTNPVNNDHGTHVSGIIAADPAYGPVRGVAPRAKIIAAPFISNDGQGSLGDAILAMQFVASRGAKVINASWGGAPCVSTLANAFATLSAQGILLVVAAGNSGLDIDQYPVYPASFQVANQITVAASTTLDFMASWSNNGRQSTHLAAPGAQIYSTLPDHSYGYMDGTSMAAPFVTGAAAALWSAKPNATAGQIRQALVRSVDVVSGHEFKVASDGRLNLRRALAELSRLVP